MAYRWLPPPAGTLKINVHDSTSQVPYPNGNTRGIGSIYRNQYGILRHLTIGSLPNLTVLGNQLWAIYGPMKRAFMMGYNSVVIETDNHEAFLVLKGFNVGANAAIFDLVEQISTLLHNRNWVCSIAFIFPARNIVARYASRLGMEVYDMLYMMSHPVGGIEELMDWDLGLGVDHPDFVDVMIPAEAPDPVNFNLGPTLVDNINNLGLGQNAAPNGIIQDREFGEIDLQDIVEETIIATDVITDEFLFAAEPPLEGID